MVGRGITLGLVVIGMLLVASTSFSVAQVAETLSLDQPDFIIRDHTASIIYTNSDRIGGSIDTETVTMSISGESDQTITVYETSKNDGVFTSPVITFQSTTGNNPANLKFHVDADDNITVSKGSLPSDTAIVKNSSPIAASDTFHGDRRADSLVTPCTLNEFTRGASTGDGDDDNDGICDGWEKDDTLMVTLDGTPSNTYRFVCGTNPCTVGVKDIFVEIDAMVGHVPNQLAINDVIDSFRQDPHEEIRLHVQSSPNEMNIIPKDACLYWTAYNDPTKPSLDRIKTKNFGTIEEQQQSDWSNPTNLWFDPADPTAPGRGNDKYSLKRLAFHYVFFGHQRCPAFNTSGTGEYDGNDVLITLKAPKFSGSRDQQAGTLMHELGHNIGLDHGGPLYQPSSTVNCKPTYLSVMNYAYQFADLVPTREIGYSRMAVGDKQGNALDENTLNEDNGVGNHTPPRQFVYGPTPPTPLPWTNTATMDWNRQSGPTTPPLNINSITDASGNVVCNESAYQSLMGYDDWSNLDLNLRDSSESNDGRAIDDISTNDVQQAINLVRREINSAQNLVGAEQARQMVNESQDALNKNETTRALSILMDIYLYGPLSPETKTDLGVIFDSDPDADLFFKSELDENDLMTMRLSRIDSLHIALYHAINEENEHSSEQVNQFMLSDSPKENVIKVSNDITIESSEIMKKNIPPKDNNKPEAVNLKFDINKAYPLSKGNLSIKLNEIKDDIKDDLLYAAAAELKDIRNYITDEKFSISEKDETKLTDGIDSILHSYSLTLNDPSIREIESSITSCSAGYVFKNGTCVRDSGPNLQLLIAIIVAGTAITIAASVGVASTQPRFAHR